MWKWVTETVKSKAVDKGLLLCIYKLSINSPQLKSGKQFHSQEHQQE